MLAVSVNMQACPGPLVLVSLWAGHGFVWKSLCARMCVDIETLSVVLEFIASRLPRCFSFPLPLSSQKPQHKIDIPLSRPQKTQATLDVACFLQTKVNTSL